MPTDPTEEDLERQIEALKSGKFKWIQPGGFVDMTAARIRDLTKQLEKLRAKKRDNFQAVDASLSHALRGCFRFRAPLPGQGCSHADLRVLSGRSFRVAPHRPPSGDLLPCSPLAWFLTLCSLDKSLQLLNEHLTNYLMVWPTLIFQALSDFRHRRTFT